MKKLSEIGVRHDRLEGYVTLPEPMVWLTLAERRELVRAVWQAALEQAEIDFFSDPRLTKGRDEFIEEHEL